MKRLVFLLLLISGNGFAQVDFFQSANAFFSINVKNGNVAYASIKAKPEQLNNLVNAIASFDLKSADAKTNKAFMINAYNLLAIKGIVDNYPVKSPFDVKDFFDAKRYTVAGEKMSLNILEKEKLYPMSKDPRLHFVLVCAAVSCPKLADFAYVPAKLESQIESKTKEVLNDDEFIRIRGNKAQVSEIFNWYANDFKSEGQSVAEFINLYRTDPLPSKKVGFYTYDWSLNNL
ncbi:MAG: DUF547 domain-containing protein [Bacteroidota bacterium]